MDLTGLLWVYVGTTEDARVSLDALGALVVTVGVSPSPFSEGSACRKSVFAA